MTMKNMSLLSGATVAATGGTALVFSDNGVTIPNGVQLVVPADTTLATRRSVTARVRAPSLGRDGVYGKDKKVMSFNVPLTLASGKIVNNVIRVEREVHPELSAANALELNSIGAQMLTDSDSASFWSIGSTS